MALVLITALTACRSGRDRAPAVVVVEPAPPPLPSPPPAPVAALTPEAPPPDTPLQVADRAFDSGDQQAAFLAYRAALEEGAGAGSDRALYRLAVLHLQGGRSRDPATGYALLRRLVREHPQSVYRIEADLILGLNARARGLEAEVERLEGQLEALKRIDLGPAAEPTPH